MNLPDSGRHVTRPNQGLFSTTMEAEKRDPGNEVEEIYVTFFCVLFFLGHYLHFTFFAVKETLLEKTRKVEN